VKIQSRHQVEHDHRRPILAFTTDPMAAVAMNEAAELEGFQDANPIEASIDQAVEMLAEMPTPIVLIADLGADVLAGVEKLAAVCDGDSTVILLGTENDVTLYRTLINMGVADYLLKPITGNGLSASIKAARAQSNHPPAPAATADTSANARAHEAVLARQL